jgi:GNAT superfamily N-acetyltransferase
VTDTALARASGSETVERASSRNKRAMIATMCAAFADDPGLNWIWPERDDRLRRLPDFFGAVIGGTMSNGIALHSGDNSHAVSLWRRPGRINPGLIETLRSLPKMAKAFQSGRERAALMSKTLKPNQPSDYPWWYLQFIGVHPNAQGSGLGGASVRAGLELARSAGMPTYVEVMNPDNVAFYLNVGFRIIGEFDIPDAGPHVWSMLAAA